MDFNEIISRQKEIDIKIRSVADKLKEVAIYDGIICPERYINSKRRILWLAREPHDDCGYDYKSDIIYKQSINQLKGKRYFNRFRFIQYSIENNYINWNREIYDNNAKEYSDLILKAAFINCNKILGGASLNWERWNTFSKHYKDTVAEQIEIANPDIVIAVGTMNYLHQFGFVEGAKKYGKSYRHYYTKNGKVFLDCYHIAARYSLKNYCNDIVDVLKLT